MLRWRCWVVFVWLLLLLPRDVWSWGQEAHRMVTSRALENLSPSLRPFYHKSRNFIVEHSVDPDFWRSVGFVEEVPRHFLDLDAYGPFPFEALSADFNEVAGKFGQEMVQKNGVLPWRVEEVFNRLVQAFERLKKGNGGYVYDDIRYFSAVLAHYAADAHVPFHAVTNYDGQLTNQQGIHSRFETELYLRYRSRLVIHLKVSAPVSDSREFTFTALRESYQLVETILKADQRAVAGLHEYDDTYFRRFAGGAKPILDRRLSQSIGAVSAMIEGAWMKGGKPALELNPIRSLRSIPSNGAGS